MRRYRFWAGALLVPALVVGVSSLGCSGDKKTESGNVDKTDGGGKSSTSGERTATKGGPKEAVVAKNWGSLKGKVTLEGAKPELKPPVIPTTVQEKDKCLQGDMRNQTWKVGGPGNGVANVIVWLQAPKGKYLQVPSELQKADPAVVKLQQPHCTFEPHVFVLYPSYYDATVKKQKPTGQVFEVTNTADFLHNTKFEPRHDVLNTGANLSIKPGSEPLPITFKPCKDNDAGGEEEVKFNCNVHQWMNAYARVFDHPFVAVTDGDAKDAKDFGSYEIKKVPTGVEVDVMYWHETFNAPKKLKTVTLKDGENTEDFTVSAK